VATNNRKAAGLSLRLLWAGPWNERSAIGFFGTVVARELVALGHHVEVFRTEIGSNLSLPVRPAPGPIHLPGSQSIAELVDNFDGVIVNLGNHYGFHGGAIPLLQVAAPLIILHDAWMGGFLGGWRKAAEDSAWRLDRFVRELSDDASGIEPFCALASGAIVHGPHYLALAKIGCPGPVAALPLAYTTECMPTPRPIGDRLVVATIGHVNANKQADQIIRAVGASVRLRNRVDYILAGPVEPEERTRLRDLAQIVGARELQFTGWVSDEALRTLIAGTDVICCLRYPALEGGSASLITAMLSQRPTLVSNHASYADIPDGLVMKCVPGNEAADIQFHLETILDAPGAARTMGERAREYALRTFNPSTYATRLLEVLDAATLAEPAIRIARMVGQRLGELGMKSDDPAVDRIDRVLAGLLCKEGNRL
jgi:glycosyltransferase involved in cell wall biosynthesis